jgi:hypothetical protein
VKVHQILHEGDELVVVVVVATRWRPDRGRRRRRRRRTLIEAFFRLFSLGKDLRATPADAAPGALAAAAPAIADVTTGPITALAVPVVASAAGPFL